MAGAAAPSLTGALWRYRVRAAAREVAADLARLRSVAVVTGQAVALRLNWSDGRYVLRIFRDGDGDGIRADDIAAGRDPLEEGPRDLPSRYEGVDFGLLDASIPEVPPGGGTLAPGSDPVRFGRSDTITFTPQGTSSSGTLYISDGRSAVMAIVVFGGSGRIRTCRFDADSYRWVC
jgi:hypothetical protein